jgi:glycosyltransferase involved in cell wall biosynthesis
MQKKDYLELLGASDAGLIFLSSHFSIPNFPSRMLDYMDCGKPILAATDKNTDFGSVVVNGGFGYWCESGNINEFNNLLNKLVRDKPLREQMGIRARQYLLDHYTVNMACKTILSHFG